MTDDEKLLLVSRLRIRLSRPGTSCSCCEFTSEELIALLEEHNWDLDTATYHALIRRAENDEIRLPDGTTLPSQRKYWLSLARCYRPNKSGNIPRSDEIAEVSGSG